MSEILEPGDTSARGLLANRRAIIERDSVLAKAVAMHEELENNPDLLPEATQVIDPEVKFVGHIDNYTPNHRFDW